MQQLETTRCEHEFVANTKTREVICNNCGLGFKFMFSDVEKVEDGKLILKPVDKSHGSIVSLLLE